MVNVPDFKTLTICSFCIGVTKSILAEYQCYQLSGLLKPKAFNHDPSLGQSSAQIGDLCGT